MTDVVPHDNPLPLLATPGERYGWIFNDRNLYRRRFTEPPPVPGEIPAALTSRAALAEKHLLGRMLAALGVGIGLATVFACCGGIMSAGDGTVGPGMFGLAVVCAVLGVAGAAWALVARHNAQRDLAARQEEVRAQHKYDFEEWDARRMRFENGQDREIDALDEWSAATPAEGTRRVDIIGGTTWGWEAVLTVLGGSLLGTRGAMTVVDFTGVALCGELIALAEQTGRTVRVTALPSQLADLDLVTGLDTRELVDSLVEAMYGDSQGTSTRADRHQDSLLLTEVAEALDGDVTMGRLLAALRVLADRPDQPALTADEIDRLGALHADETRRQMHGSLRRIESFLRPLERMGGAGTPAGAVDLTCLIADSDGRNAQGELLKDLIVQWLIRQVGRSGVTSGSLVLVGADEVGHRHLERLSTMCERRGIRLVLLFSHLREDSLQTIGGGEVGFMRLGNHTEAQQAAEFIGRQHTFVLSQLTRTLGGNDTHTLADTEGYSVSRGGSSGTSRAGAHISRQSGATWSVSRNWSQTESFARGSNWSDAAAAQRVYEYAVEPRVLQDLPDYALLLVKREGRGSVVQAVECNPALVTMPRLSMEAVPLRALPDPADAVVPATRHPSQVTVSRPAPLATAPEQPHQWAPPLQQQDRQQW
jgi:hypothetical protein